MTIGLDIITTLDLAPLTIEYDNYHACFYIGGNFKTPTPYAFSIKWNTATSSYIVGSHLYDPNAPVSIIYNSPSTLGGASNNIYTVETNTLYKNDEFIQTLSGATDTFTTIIYNQFSSSVDWFATNNISSNPHPFYHIILTRPIIINLTNSVVFNDNIYKNNITLSIKGNTIELIWYDTQKSWYIIGSNSSFTIS